jgi:hypothetical protein
MAGKGQEKCVWSAPDIIEKADGRGCIKTGVIILFSE